MKPEKPNTKCADCDFDGWGPMLHDEVWLKINGQKPGMLCMACMEKRLKRLINVADLRICAMNMPLIYVLITRCNDMSLHLKLAAEEA